MEINVHENSKTVEVWLTSAEKADPAMQERLKPLYAEYKAKKYTVAVFLSGRQELYPTLRDLLAYNKKRTAELAVQREKQRPARPHHSVPER